MESWNEPQTAEGRDWTAKQDGNETKWSGNIEQGISTAEGRGWTAKQDGNETKWSGNIEGLSCFFVVLGALSFSNPWKCKN